MRKLLIATRNKGKFPEIIALLEGLPLRFLSLNDVKQIPPDFNVEETGETFADNAILKAREYGRMSGLLTLADDSGLEVDALAGRPGVYSSRYGPTAQERNRKLLQEMADVPDEKRGAQFKGVVAIYDHETDRS